MGELEDNLKELKEAIINAWETIKRLAKEAYEIFSVQERRTKHKYNWRIPLNTCRDHQVMGKRITVPHVRDRA